ncbi:hypothetical protein CERSUDRAFT_94126 [Gelatoporia subvermispora B]|uniref:Chromatin assembly factor 1 subunit A dimerization domain-containing protein n=1 Tax=Ceriporiopsis subvermispora (strain B) TaxID=914234 RepID=M2R242_CERS8|nr:hypothetical protein CERSUDRAFT_94126 [Gelatoporia subvermispora B]
MSETMQEIVKFRTMLEERIRRQEPPLTTIPEEHKPLIAKYVHDSDKTLPALTKHIHHELLPLEDEEDEEASTLASKALPQHVVENAIKSVANRNNYGLDYIPGGDKVPAALLVWKWEVKDEHRGWLPKAAREKVEIRLAERRQAKKDVKVLFESLSDEQKIALIGSKGLTKSTLKAKANSLEEGILASKPIDVDAGSPSRPHQERKHSMKTTDPNGDGQSTKSSEARGRPKKPADPEKLAKEKEKQEKKAAKAERERKEKEAHDKSRSIMASFFGKAKAAPQKRPPALSKDASPAIAGPSTSHSDFERMFKPFALKKGAELAPINWFKAPRKRSAPVVQGNVIVLDDDIVMEDNSTKDVQMTDAQDTNLGQLSAQERLHQTLSNLPPALNQRCIPCRRPSYLKTHTPISVRSLMNRLSEAEVTGDDAEVRSLISLLRDRARIPAKVLIFTEDARPGYFGTWTRNSAEIGPRTPFARDVVALDYTYDSGEEWEDESGEADDVVEDAEEEDVGDEQDSDVDSWLVDDDDVDPGTPIEERESSPGMFPIDFPSLPSATSKRKVGDESSTQSKKRKVVVPLVPFTKGPCWEPTIGECEYEPFNAYRIQLFNDTSYPIDPFTFVSQDIDELTSSSSRKEAVCDGFVIPALPPHVTSHANSSVMPNANHKRGVLSPKTTFPDVHLPLLLAKITSLSTSSLAYIVETVHQDLKVHRVKKNAIEAKVREIGEKCKEKKVWVVKSSVLAS